MMGVDDAEIIKITKKTWKPKRIITIIMTIMVTANSNNNTNDDDYYNGKDHDEVYDNENLKNYDKDDKKIMIMTMTIT